jgi:hypothetical protein
MKILTIIALASCLLFSCDIHDDWKCEGNCNTGYGVKKWRDGGYEKGYWRNGSLYGKGEEFFGATSSFAGDKYVGNFDNGYSGYGVYYGKKLDFIHKGNWKNGKSDGYSEGTFGPNADKPGWSYKGNWENGKKSGYGELYMGTVGSHAGIKYFGNWLNDKMDGLGTYAWPDSSKYIGHFSNDLFDGKARFTFSDGMIYMGIWHEGYNADFLNVLKQHSQKAKDRDSILLKYFYSKE